MDQDRTDYQENICKLVEWYEDPQHICLILEYVAGGDLLDYIMNWPGARGLRESAQFIKAYGIQPKITLLN